MQQRRCLHDGCAKGAPNRLMTETDAEYRNRRSVPSHRLYAHAGVLRTTGARRDHDPVRRKGANVFDGDSVVPLDDQVGTKLPEILDEVVRERVVVVDDQYHLYRRQFAYPTIFSPCPL